MKRILLIQTAFLGDVILATAAVAELHRIYPDAAIDILVKQGNQSLLENNPKLNNVFVFNKSNGKLKAIWRLIRTFRKQRYDLVVNFHRFGSSGLIAALAGGKKTYGFKKNPFSFAYTKSFPHPFGDGTHEVTRNLNLLSEFGVSTIARPELYPSESAYARIREYQQQPYVTMAPASVWFTKQLPVHKWIELINQQDSNKHIYLLGAPGDKVLCETIVQRATHQHITILAGELSLLESAALMQGATRNYVNDSGPLHLASAMNAPTTAFFCSTVPAFGFGPLAEDSNVLEVQNLDCRPCGMHGHRACPLGHFKCGEIDLQQCV